MHSEKKRETESAPQTGPISTDGTPTHVRNPADPSEGAPDPAPLRPLGTRLLLYAVCFGIGVTVVQMALEYHSHQSGARHERARIQAHIEELHLPLFRTEYTRRDIDSLHMHAESLLTLSEVACVRIEEGGLTLIESGSPPRHGEWWRYPLGPDGGEEASAPTATLHAAYDTSAHRRALGWTLGAAFLHNAAWVFFVVGFVFLLFRQAVLLRLRVLTRRVGSPFTCAGGADAEAICTETPPAGDELDRLAWGIEERERRLENELARRARTEAELREKGRMLEEAQDIGGIGHWWYDLASGEIRWSQEVYALFERDPERGEPDYEEVMACYHEDDRAALLACIRAVIETGEAQQIDVRLRTGRGSLRHINCRLRAVGTGSPVTQLVGTVQDITARVEDKRRLGRALERLTFHVENTPLAVVEWDAAFRVTRWSPMAERLFGWSAPEVIGRDPTSWRFVHEEDAEAVGEIMQGLLSGKLPRNSFHNRNYTKDGRILWCGWYNSVLFDDAGRVVSVLSLVQDLTELVESTNRLREGEERYRLVADHTHDWEYWLGEDGVLRYISPSCERITGYRREEFLTDPDLLARVVHPSDRAFFRSHVHEVLESGEVEPIFFRIVRRNGDIRWISHICTRVYGDDGRPMGQRASNQDVTARRRAEAERGQLAQRLQEKNTELESLVYVTSHDLRTPLVNIQGFGRELARSCNALAERVAELTLDEHDKDELLEELETNIPRYLDFILGGVVKMDTLLAGLLRLSRLGKVELQPQRLDMNRLVIGVESTVAYRATQNGVRIERGELPPCTGDRTQITQVFTNLLDNAIKYLDPARPGRIRITGERTGRDVVYTVEDNGRGIAEGHQKQVFEIFHRLDPDGVPGEGLGLTSVRRIVDRHGGRIWVESERGTGSRFFVSLPAAEAGTETESAHAHDTEAGAETAAAGTRRRAPAGAKETT